MKVFFGWINIDKIIISCQRTVYDQQTRKLALFYLDLYYNISLPYAFYSNNKHNYDPDNSRLHIKFVSGLEYDYKDVPPEIYKGLKIAGSKGRYLNLIIKGKYEFDRIS